MALPRDVVGWSSMCDCVFSWLQSLNFLGLLELYNVLHVYISMFGKIRQYKKVYFSKANISVVIMEACVSEYS